jgi:hypothetical protein
VLPQSTTGRHLRVEALRVEAVGAPQARSLPGPAAGLVRAPLPDAVRSASRPPRPPLLNRCQCDAARAAVLRADGKHCVTVTDVTLSC